MMNLLFHHSDKGERNLFSYLFSHEKSLPKVSEVISEQNNIKVVPK